MSKLTKAQRAEIEKMARADEENRRARDFQTELLILIREALEVPMELSSVDDGIKFRYSGSDRYYHESYTVGIHYTPEDYRHMEQARSLVHDILEEKREAERKAMQIQAAKSKLKNTLSEYEMELLGIKV